MKSRSQIVRTALLAVALAVSASILRPAHAQSLIDPSKLPTQPVKVDVTLSRYQGEKKTSNLPFSLYASAGPNRQNQVSMRMGIDVPVGSTTSNQTVNGGPKDSQFPASTTATTSTKVEYRSVGTNVDCQVWRLDETHYSVYVNVNDSSVYSADGDAKSLKNLDPAAFRTFSTSNTVVLRDGQTLLFGTGTDKVSGEVLKVEVTLSVIK